MELRNKLRAVTIGAVKKPRSKVLEINGEKLEVRQPTIKQRDDLRSKCIDRIPLDNGDFEMKLDSIAYQIWGVILFTYIPGTNERVFENADFDLMANSFTGSFVDDLYEVFVELSNVDIKHEKKS